MDRAVVLARHPEGAIGEADFAVVEVPRPALQDGFFRTQNRVLSLDAGFRQWMNAGAGAIQSEFADADCHAAGTLVAYAEYCLVISDDHQSHVRKRRGFPNHLFNPAPEVRCNEQSAATAEDTRVITRGLANGRRINDRHDFCEMIFKQLVKQHFIPILEHGEADVATDIVAVVENGFKYALGLLLNIIVFRRQKPFDTEFPALLVRKGCAFVVQGESQQIGTLFSDAQRIAVTFAHQFKFFHVVRFL